MSFSCELLGINCTLKWRDILLCRRANCLSVALLFPCSDVCLSVLRRWFSIQNSQLVYQKKLKVSVATPDGAGRLASLPGVLLCWGLLRRGGGVGRKERGGELDQRDSKPIRALLCSRVRLH